MKLHGIGTDAAPCSNGAIAHAVLNRMHDAPLGGSEHVIVGRAPPALSTRHEAHPTIAEPELPSPYAATQHNRPATGLPLLLCGYSAGVEFFPAADPLTWQQGQGAAHERGITRGIRAFRRRGARADQARQ